MNTKTNTSSNPITDLPKPRPRRMHILVIIAIFITGTITGGACTAVIIVNCLQNAIKHPERVPHRIAVRLDRKLGLTDQQTSQIEQILLDSQKKLTDLRREVQPRIEAQLDTTADDIANVLNESQQEKWYKIFHRMRDKWTPPLDPNMPQIPTQNDTKG